MRRSAICTLVIGITGIIACGDATSGSQGTDANGAEGIPFLGAVGSVVDSLVRGLDDPDDLFAGSDLVALDDRLAVVLMAGPGVSTFTPDLDPIDHIEPNGQGPGELQGVWGGVRTPEGDLAILDSGNARITVFDPDLRYGTSVASEGFRVTSIGAIGGNRFAVGLGPRASLFGPDGRSWIGAAPDSVPGGHSPHPVLAVELEEGPVLIRLETDGSLLIFGVDGVDLGRYPIPSPVREELDAYAADGPFGPSIWHTKMHLVPVPGGVLILTALAESPLLHFDLETRRWTRLELPEDDRSRTLLATAIDAAWLDGTLYTLGRERLDAFPVELSR